MTRGLSEDSVHVPSVFQSCISKLSCSAAKSAAKPFFQFMHDRARNFRRNKRPTRQRGNNLDATLIESTVDRRDATSALILETSRYLLLFPATFFRCWIHRRPSCAWKIRPRAHCRNSLFSVCASPTRKTARKKLHDEIINQTCLLTRREFLSRA